MSLIDRIKFDGTHSREWLIYRYPGDEFTSGSQLVVGEGQTAIFVKNGRVCDVFGPGTYTLSTKNLPVLSTFVNIPFGGLSPFTAEVYFVNTVAKLDINWGTPDPIQLVDPKYQISIRIRAFGQIGLKINDLVSFFTGIIGTMSPADVVSFNKVLGFYKGILITKVKSMIADIIINQKISALEISAKIDWLSEQITELLRPSFEEFGFRVVNFFIKSINFPPEDFEAINKILENKAEFDIIGDARYATMRSFDVYENAAKNENGVAGAFVAGGMGIGAGAAVAGGIGSVVSSPAEQKIFCPSCHAANIPQAKFCVACGKAIASQEFDCPECGAKYSQGTKFCSNCGVSLAKTVCDCGAEVTPGAKFCSSCGKKTQED